MGDRCCSPSDRRTCPSGERPRSSGARDDEMRTPRSCRSGQSAADRLPRGAAPTRSGATTGASIGKLASSSAGMPSAAPWPWPIWPARRMPRITSIAPRNSGGEPSAGWNRGVSDTFSPGPTWRIPLPSPVDITHASQRAPGDCTDRARTRLRKSRPARRVEPRRNRVRRRPGRRRPSRGGTG